MLQLIVEVQGSLEASPGETVLQDWGSGGQARQGALGRERALFMLDCGPRTGPQLQCVAAMAQNLASLGHTPNEGVERSR